MPQRKKPDSVRGRRNKASTRATLTRITDETTTAEAYQAMTVAQLREAIDLANQSRPADQQISKRGAKATLVAVLVAASSSIPELPKKPPRYDDEGYEVEQFWHPQTEAWWNDVWTSPMSDQWDDSDVHNLYLLALLYDDIWRAETSAMRAKAMAEYRLQRADLGLSPYARRRLEWTIETAEEAKARGERRRGGNGGRTQTEQQKAAAKRPDPRLSLVQ